MLGAVPVTPFSMRRRHFGGDLSLWRWRAMLSHSQTNIGIGGEPLTFSWVTGTPQKAWRSPPRGCPWRKPKEWTISASDVAATGDMRRVCRIFTFILRKTMTKIMLFSIAHTNELIKHRPMYSIFRYGYYKWDDYTAVSSNGMRELVIFYMKKRRRKKS